mgnify:FL=1
MIYLITLRSYIQYVLFLEDASGEGEQGCWFGEGECHQSSETESGSLSDYLEWGKSGHPRLRG